MRQFTVRYKSRHDKNSPNKNITTKTPVIYQMTKMTARSRQWRSRAKTRKLGRQVRSKRKSGKTYKKRFHSNFKIQFILHLILYAYKAPVSLHTRNADSIIDIKESWTEETNQRRGIKFGTYRHYSFDKLLLRVVAELFTSHLQIEFMLSQFWVLFTQFLGKPHASWYILGLWRTQFLILPFFKRGKLRGW